MITPPSGKYVAPKVTPVKTSRPVNVAKTRPAVARPRSLAPTPGKTPAPTRTVVPKPKARRPVPPPAAAPKRPAVLSPASYATQQVNASLAPLYAAQTSQASGQNAAITNLTQAVMAALKGTPDQIGSEYDQAIGQQTNLSNAAAASLRAVNPNTQDQAILSAINAPQAQQAQVAAQNSNVFNGGAAVGQYVGGVLPMSSLEGQKLAATTYARELPAIEGLRGQQNLGAVLTAQTAARQQIDAQRPDLIQKYQNSFTDAQQRQTQLNYEAKALGLKTNNQTFNQGLAKAKYLQAQNKYISDYKLRVNEFNARQDASAAKAALPNATLSRARGYLVDSAGNAINDSAGKKQILPGFSVNGKGRVVKVSAAKAGQLKPFADLTKTQVSTLRATANELRFGTVYNGKNPATVNGKVYKTGDKIPAFSYNQAVSYLVGKGYSRLNAIRMLNNFYLPGQAGRPTKGQVAASGRVRAANAQASQGNDATGLGIIVR